MAGSVEQAQRAALSTLDRRGPGPFWLQPYSLGQPLPAFHLVKAHALSDALDDDCKRFPARSARESSGGYLEMIETLLLSE